jgi:hypothetical protein
MGSSHGGEVDPAARTQMRPGMTRHSEMSDLRISVICAAILYICFSQSFVEFCSIEGC